MNDRIICLVNRIDFEKEFIIDDICTKRYTYSQVFLHAFCVAKYLFSEFDGNDVIAVLDNSYELILLYFAIMLTDKRIIVIDPQKGRKEIENILLELSPAPIFADKCIEIDTGRHLVVDIDRIKFCLEEQNKIDIKDTVIEGLRKRHNRQPYLVTYTSGTSGLPKGVEHSLDNLFMTAVALAKKIKKRDGVFLHVMPMTYMAGILNSLFYPFISGDRIVVCDRFSIVSSRNFWKCVMKYNADVFWLSPSMLSIISQMDRNKLAENYCKKRKLTFLIGTAPLTNEMRNKFNNRYSTSVFASYGLSETLFVSVETEESQERSDLSSVGEVLDGVRYRFSETGEILLDVDWMYLGYINQDTSEYFDGKYYKSGDLGEIRNDCLYITGRSKDLIIKGGLNVSPGLIEEVIYANPAIVENAVLGITIEGEERVCCVYSSVETAHDLRALENDVKKMVVDRLGNHYSIDFMWHMQEIPKNINGKIDKNYIREMWSHQNEQYY